jgi:membrane protein DedA with SNARE-associated domain
LFTIAAGASHMALLPFVFASIFGRGLRFFLVAWIVSHLGKKLEPLIVKYIEWMGWLGLVLIGIIILVYQIY